MRSFDLAGGDTMIPAVMFWGYSFAEVLIGAVIVIALVAIAYVIVTKGMGVAIPDWVRQVFWIMVAAFVFILVVKFLLSL